MKEIPNTEEIIELKNMMSLGLVIRFTASNYPFGTFKGF
jgi:hypothetical protein